MKATNLQLVRARVPSSPLPSKEEVPLFNEEMVKRFPELVDYNEEIKAFHEKLLSFILEQDRLLNETLTEIQQNHGK